MKMSSCNLFICAGILGATALFTGCKSGGTIPVPSNKSEAEKLPAPDIQADQKPSDIFDARTLLNRSVENSLKAQSVASDISMNIEMLGMSMPLNFNMVKNGELSHTQGSFMGMRFEFYSDGKNMVMLDPMRGKWMRVPDEQRDMVLSFDKMQGLMYGDNLSEAVFSGEEKIQDKAYQIINAAVKPESFNEMLVGQKNPMMQDMDVKFDQASVKIWLDKNSGLLYKVILDMEATLTGDIPGLEDSGDEYDIEDEDEAPETKTSPQNKNASPKTSKIKYQIEIIYSDYNRVPLIEIPLEIKNLMERPADSGPENE